MRYWSVSHAGLMQRLYDGLEWVLIKLSPLWRWIGYRRLERPFAAVERGLKGWLFDCQMCGHCILQSTGMSCPMNCPKQLRNGPCSGVRADGGCEVIPHMRCVWVEAVRGAANMPGGDAIQVIQAPLDHSLQGRSAWLREVRLQTEARSAQFVADAHAS